MRFWPTNKLEQAKDVKPDQIIDGITVVQEAPPTNGQSRVKFSTNPSHGEKIGRDQPCPCGSGQKFKRCYDKNGETRYHRP